MDIKTFLFGPYPLSFQTIDIIFIASVFASLPAAIILLLVTNFKNFNPVTRGLISRFKSLAWFYAIAGLLWSAFRYENATYLSWRLWFIIILLVSLTWLFRIVRYYFRGYQQDFAQYKDREVKSKYLKKK